MGRLPPEILIEKQAVIFRGTIPENKLRRLGVEPYCKAKKTGADTILKQEWSVIATNSLRAI
jgi:hypothetical protein